MSSRFLWRPSKFSSTSLNCCAAASASSRRTLSTIWLARILSVGLRSRGSVAGLKGLTTTLAGSGRRYKALAVQELGLGQRCSLGSFEVRSRRSPLR